jgi:uncharacterized protein (DUF3084 family)
VSFRLKNMVLGLIILLIATGVIFLWAVDEQNRQLELDNYQIQLVDCQNEVGVFKAENQNVKQENERLKVSQEKWYKEAINSEYKLGTCKKNLATANGDAREEYQFANGTFHTCVYVIYRLTGQAQYENCAKFTQSLLDEEIYKQEPSEQFYQYFGGLNHSSVKQTPKGTEIKY